MGALRRFRRFRFALSGWVRWAVLAVAAAYLLVRLVDLVLAEPLAVAAETEARLRGIDAINRIVLGTLGKNLTPNDLIVYNKDEQGRIAGFHVNTLMVNRVASEAATAVHREFRTMSEETFGVPVGALFGSQLLATVGPQIPVRMMPIGTVAIDINQEFKSEGINQTRHRIWVRATARVRVILPMVAKEMEVTGDMPVTETVIVGPVPNGFYGGGTLGGVTLPASP